VDKNYSLDEEILEPDDVIEVSEEDEFINNHEGASEPKDVYYFVDYETDLIKGTDTMLPTVFLMKIKEFEEGNTLIAERSHPYVDLPNNFINIDTAMWQVNGLKSEVEAKLKELGFTQSEKFVEAMEEWSAL